MTPNEFQENVLRTAKRGLDFKDSLVNCSLGLAGETGEFVDLIKKYLYHGKELDSAKCKDELGDICFYVAWMANVFGFTFEDVLTRNVEKLKARYPLGFIPGGGIRSEG
jgi:NTP pyrophosphatase (non-canonical NTP hydrolase)